ncbi:Ig-like domain-containing protein [Citrobacter sp. Cm046]|uniref:Ig-like domain-containing protein n=1 Tax=Citrobacter sp. Cm046 TaxID=2985118 RepID=UPI002577BEF9|nr:Ig-like domain-containing protein [Citrobacter sp. Cm046]MDM2927801.1 Ig-like domain-containing protein [Citrobacter sp. Cm046]
MHARPDRRFSARLIQTIALLNIFLQIVMPVLLSFSWVSVAVAASPSEQQFSQSMTTMRNSALLSAVPDSPPEENDKIWSSSSVELNVKKTSQESSGFFSSQPTKSAELPALASEPEAGKTSSVADPELQMIDSGKTAATRLWQVLGSDDPAAQGRSAAAGIAAGIANQRMETWLNQYGHAQVNLSFPGGGDLDLLFPMLDTADYLIFTQGGIRRDTDDKRTTSNIGLGVRGFTGNWMLGVNSFYDYDITGENSRYGIGTEAWTDYLKLSANLYQRITDWHQSGVEDMEDYDERPANGYDVRLAGWLPSYPNVGMNATYEKYFGKNVALDDHTDLADSPSAVTVGLNYTPIPLVTLGAEHRSGSNTNDSRVFLNFNYRLGVSMADQTDPDMVGLARTLAGSRYDMVERNNTIVMQYKKQDLITLSLPATVSADANSTVSLTADVRAKYGTESVDWDYSSIVNAGGSVTQQSRESLLITLPAWKAEQGSVNTYRISAVAYDSRHNKSNSAETVVMVHKARNDISSFVVVNDNALADGNTRNTVRLTVIDTQTNQPVPGLAVKFATSAGTLLAASATTDAQGMATTEITSVVAGEAKITATLENGNAADVSVTFLPDEAATLSDLKITKDNAAADGKATNVVQASVTDARGNAVAGITVAFSAGNGAVLENTSVVTDAKGLASTTLTNLSMGTTVVTATANNVSRSVNTTFTADVATAFISSLTVDQDSSPADGKTTNTATVTVLDAQGHPVPGIAVAWQADKGTVKFSSGSSNTGADGKVSVQFTDTVAESTNITAVLANGSSQSQPSHFSVDLTALKISRFDVAQQIKADGRTVSTSTVIVVDAANTPQANVVVNWTVDGTASLAGPTSTTDTSGQAVMTLTDAKAETVNVTVTVSVSGATQTKTTTFVADTDTAVVSTLVINQDGSVANGSAANTATATVLDANNNPVAGAAVVWSADKGTVRFGTQDTTDANGHVSVTFTDTVAETAQITATLGSSSQTEPSKFVADAATAVVSTLVINQDGSVANGSAANTATATVLDANNNPVAGAEVVWSADKGTVRFGTQGTTDANGHVSVTFTDTVAETAQITATLGGSSQTELSKFVGDAATATLTLLPDHSGSIADGIATNGVTAMVVDALNNPIAGAIVTWTVDKSTAKLSVSSGVTDSSGKTSLTYTDTVAEHVEITATLENGSSKVQGSTFVADASTARIGSIVIDPDNSPANGASKNGVAVTVVDANGNPVGGLRVALSASSNTVEFSSKFTSTNQSGVASATFTDTVAETISVTAGLDNGSAKSQNSHFVGDAATAVVSTLTINTNNSVANGSTANTATATVLDANNNPVAGAAVVWSTDKGTVNFGTQGTTDANGHVSVTFTDTVAETAQITATLGGSSQTEPSLFIADAATAVPSSLVIDPNGSVADGVTANVATVTVLDAHNNPVSGINVSWSPDSDGTMRFSPTSGATGIDGKMTVRITDTRSRNTYIGVWVNGNYLSEIIEFVADPATAAVSSLTIDKNGSVANGVATNSATATVLDAHNNPVAGATVTWSADKGTVNFGTQGTTDANGQVSVTFTDTVAETAQITATLGGSSQTSPSRFNGDITSAVVSTLTIDTDGSAANGSTANVATATVLDANNNPVSGAAVTWSADKGTVSFGTQDTTDANGHVSVNFTDTVAETAQITATLGGSSQTEPSKFVADAATAVVSTLVIDQDGSVANGSAANTATATVLDANNNPVAGAAVAWTADKGTVRFGTQDTTDANGQVSVTFTDTVAETAQITAKLGSSSQTEPSVFIGDIATARVTVVTIDTDGSVANGSATNVATAMVLDVNNNPVANATVNWTADKTTVVFDTTPSITDAEGHASVAFTDTKAETAQITATLGSTPGKSQTSSFVADASTATVVKVITSDISLVNKMAQITVQDANGNMVSGMKVTWSVDSNNASLSPSAGVTDESGVASVSIKDFHTDKVALSFSFDSGQLNTMSVSFDGLCPDDMQVNRDYQVADGQSRIVIYAYVKNCTKPGFLTSEEVEALGDDAYLHFGVSGVGTISNISGVPGTLKEMDVPVSESAGATVYLTSTEVGTSEVSISAAGSPENFLSSGPLDFLAP